MQKSNLFTNKIKDLTYNELEYTEDFFKQAFGEADAKNSLADLEHMAKQGHRDISYTFTDSDIDENWLEKSASFEGQLAVDVFQSEQDMFIVSTVAGVRSQDLDINIDGDMITIKGIRRHRVDNIADEDYFIRECYWGGFSRSIILPVDIQYDRVEASLENGVLTIRLPKSTRAKNGKIDVVEV